MSTTDATTKIIGFEYQKMIALLKCLEAKDHTHIYLECKGDVSDESTAIEVKHSIDSSKTLYDTHIDFWKTLGNLVQDFSSFSKYSKLILHTTASIQKTSIFFNWDDLTPKQKAEKVLAVIPNATIQKHFDKVKECKINELRIILGKFIIEEKQSNITDLYNEKILKHIVVINSVESKHREPLVQRLMGYIDSTLIKSGKYNYKWKINVDEFRDALQSELKKHLIEDFIFPIVSKHEVNPGEEEFSFTKKLKDIGYDGMISFAVNDYLRAQKSRIKMIKGRYNLSNELDIYDDEISEDMYSLKVKHYDKLKDGVYDSIEKGSKIFYDECISQTATKINIEGVKGVRNYYPKGRLHFNAEEDKRFNWLLEKKDES